LEPEAPFANRLHSDIHRLFLAARAKQAAGRLDSIASTKRRQFEVTLWQPSYAKHYGQSRTAGLTRRQEELLAVDSPPSPL
jgi:hypothetical protein